MFKNMIHTLEAHKNNYATAKTSKEKLWLADKFTKTELPVIINELKYIELKEE